jgi:hypothetical protein
LTAGATGLIAGSFAEAVLEENANTAASAARIKTIRWRTNGWLGESGFKLPLRFAPAFDPGRRGWARSGPRARQK